MFKIGEFAKLNRITISTLRHYDFMDLLKPVKTDEMTGYRYYSAKQMPRISRILKLKEMGFSLEEITLILKGNVDRDALLELLSRKEKEIQNVISREEERLNSLKDFVSYLDQEGKTMEYDVLLKKTDKIKVAGLREFISERGNQEHLWTELVDYINKNHGRMIPPCMVIYYDSKGPENAIDAEVLEGITGELKGNERVSVRYLEPLEAVCVVHKGPYSTLSRAYEALSDWIEGKGYKLAGPHRELYLKGEWDSDSEDEYITELQIPVEKKNR